MERYLVTTADEKTWPMHRPVLFLGEWCRHYERKSSWQAMDAELAEPFGVDPLQRSRDKSYVLQLSNQILIELAEQLNRFHGSRYSIRQWNIILGHWLQRIVAMTFTRYFTIEQAAKNYSIAGTSIGYSQYQLTTLDSFSFNWARYDEVWSHVFYSRILEFMGTIPLDFTPHITSEESRFSFDRSPQDVSTSRFRKMARKHLGRLLQRFCRNKDAFLINTYLPRVEEAKLQYSLGQFPQRWMSPSLKTVEPNPDLRKKFIIHSEPAIGFEKFVRQILTETIPTCYLEGFPQLLRQVEALPWPKQPKFIFTSNNFDTDELFKVWTALKIEQRIPYFVGQHGNNYGALVGHEQWPEMVSCDKFFTWGWVAKPEKQVPAFIFKNVGQSKQISNPRGGLLLIETSLDCDLMVGDRYFDHARYLEEQQQFVAALSNSIRKQLTIRLHSWHRLLSSAEEQRWRDAEPDLRTDTGTVKIAKLIEQSRLIVHSYDSTGILETLSLNIPTMCFWRGELHHLLPRAKPYYELLRAVGIFVDSPKQIAELINLRWANLNEWWLSEEVQHAREVFCAEYARSESKPIATLKQLLLKASTIA